MTSSDMEESRVNEELKKADELAAEIQEAIRTKDEQRVSDFFEDNFIFEGCKKNYTKDRLIPLLVNISYDVTRVIRAQTQVERVDSHHYLTSMNKFFMPMTSEFIVSDNWKLVSGRSLDCDESDVQQSAFA